jgi:hypothetical protein
MVDLSIVFLLTFTRPGKSNLETKDAALQFIWNSPSPGAAYWAPISTCPSSLALARKEIWQTRQLWQYFIASPYIYNIYIYTFFLLVRLSDFGHCFFREISVTTPQPKKNQHPPNFPWASEPKASMIVFRTWSLPMLLPLNLDAMLYCTEDYWGAHPNINKSSRIIPTPQIHNYFHHFAPLWLSFTMDQWLGAPLQDIWPGQGERHAQHGGKKEALRIIEIYRDDWCFSGFWFHLMPQNYQLTRVIGNRHG